MAPVSARRTINISIASDPHVPPGRMHTSPDDSDSGYDSDESDSLPDCPLVADRAFVPLTTAPHGEGRTIKVLYDSGAQASLLSRKDFNTLRKANVPLNLRDPRGYNLTAANGTTIHHSHVVEAKLYTPTNKIRVPFFVCPGASTSILGMNAIVAFRLFLDPDAPEHIADVRPSADAVTLDANNPGDVKPTFRARATRSFDIPAREGLTRCRMELIDDDNNPVRGFRRAVLDTQFSATFVTTDNMGRFYAPLSNLEYDTWKVDRHDVIASVEDPRNYDYMTSSQAQRRMVATVPSRPHTPEEIEAIRDMITKSVRASVPYLHQQETINLLMEFQDVFSATRNDVGFCPLLQHSIHLKDDHPIFRPQFQIPSDHLAAIKDQTLAWIKAGIVRRGHSRYNNPIFAVPKPHNRGLRIVLDYRALNEATLPDKYCIPSVDETLQRIGDAGAQWFSSIDLSSGFYHIPLREQDQHLTAYTLPGFGQFFWRRAAMGLTGSPATFNRVIDIILNDVSNCLSYVDDILCFTKDVPSHLRTLRTILTRLRKAGLRANAEKSVFLTQEVEYLGASISRDGIRPTLDKTKAVADLQPPSTRRQLSSVLGFFNYMARYIHHYTAKIEPLSRLLKNEHGYKGGPITPDALRAFNRIKDELACRPQLGYILKDMDFHLYVDAALGGARNHGKGFGAVLLQDTPNGIRRPVAYLSRSLQPHEANYPTGLAELKAVIWAVHKLAPYLKHRRFYLYSDHRPLTDKMLGARHTKTYANCDTQMEGFFPIWRPVDGSANVIADFLSRYHGMKHPTPADCYSTEDPDTMELRKQAHCALVTHHVVNLLRTDESLPRLRWLQQQDPTCRAIFDEIAPFVTGSNPTNPVVASSDLCPHPVTIWQGILMVKPNRPFNPPEPSYRPFLIYVPSSMRQELANSNHGAHIAFSGHWGHKKVITRLSRRFWWPGLTADVKNVVDNCGICKQATNKGRPPPPPQRPIRTPTRPNDIIQLDLHGPVTTFTSTGAFILIIVDSLTKHLTLKLLPDKTENSVAKQLLDYCRVFGVPKDIITDNGPEFCNQVNNELCRLLGINHRLTATYHPQTNGLSEEINQTIQDHIQKVLCQDHRIDSRDVGELLFNIEASYNTSPHTATRITPHEARFGYPDRLPLHENYDDVFDPPANPDLGNMDYITRHIQTLRDCQRIAHRNTENLKDKVRIHHDLKTGARSPNYAPRQPVFVTHFNRGPVNPKFHPRNRPAWIIKQFRPDVYIIYVPSAGRGQKGRLTKVNARSLKPAAPGTKWLTIAKLREFRGMAQLPPAVDADSQTEDDPLPPDDTQTTSPPASPQPGPSQPLPDSGFLSQHLQPHRIALPPSSSSSSPSRPTDASPERVPSSRSSSPTLRAPLHWPHSPPPVPPHRSPPKRPASQQLMNSPKRRPFDILFSPPPPPPHNRHPQAPPPPPPHVPVKRHAPSPPSSSPPLKRTLPLRGEKRPHTSSSSSGPHRPTKRILLPLPHHPPPRARFPPHILPGPRATRYRPRPIVLGPPRPKGITPRRVTPLFPPRIRRVVTRLPSRPHVPPRHLIAVLNPLPPHHHTLPPDPLLGTVAPPPPLGPLRLPQKRGLQPLDRISRLHPQRGRPRKFIHAQSAEDATDALRRRLRLLSLTEAGRRRLNLDLAAGLIPMDGIPAAPHPSRTLPPCPPSMPHPPSAPPPPTQPPAPVRAPPPPSLRTVSRSPNSPLFSPDPSSHLRPPVTRNPHLPPSRLLPTAPHPTVTARPPAANHRVLHDPHLPLANRMLARSKQLSHQLQSHLRYTDLVHRHHNPPPRPRRLLTRLFRRLPR